MTALYQVDYNSLFILSIIFSGTVYGAFSFMEPLGFLGKIKTYTSSLFDTGLTLLSIYAFWALIPVLH